MTGGRLQLINGFCLLASFFLVRGVWGWYMAYSLFTNLWRNRDNIDPVLTGVYFFSNMSLNALNIYWFTKMISALRRRMSPAKESSTGEVKKRK